MPIKRISGKAQNSLSGVKNEGSGANLRVSKKETGYGADNSGQCFFRGCGRVLCGGGHCGRCELADVAVRVKQAGLGLFEQVALVIFLDEHVNTGHGATFLVRLVRDN